MLNNRSPGLDGCVVIQTIGTPCDGECTELYNQLDIADKRIICAFTNPANVYASCRICVGANFVKKKRRRFGLVLRIFACTSSKRFGAMIASWASSCT